jgi:hypothetical protein
MSSLQIILSYTMEHAAQDSVPNRIKIYRALSDICGSEEESNQLKQLANELEASDNRCREFAFIMANKNFSNFQK